MTTHTQRLNAITYDLRTMKYPFPEWEMKLLEQTVLVNTLKEQGYGVSKPINRMLSNRPWLVTMEGWEI